jgi:hypothetical protein
MKSNDSPRATSLLPITTTTTNLFFSPHRVGWLNSSLPRPNPALKAVAPYVRGERLSEHGGNDESHQLPQPPIYLFIILHII